ncbi:hypothetical protein [Salinibacillus xinjiangensis]|uniref:Uncharacterized protein n=1 Tax=Salinibacillus xinjiangensis TaxID=1229268 RepID=A0A6G1X1C7_9BACI|nr:hypothetical protein [Salinibacillus xinjiangensis]MRG84797.1 hypothetical protein [Salinibacillus xinjiangensis]
MKKLFLVGFLFMCGVTFYYIDPMQLFSLADDQLKEIVDSDFEVESPAEQEGKTLASDHNSNTTLDEQAPETSQGSEQTAESIIEKYKEPLNQLKDQVKEKLDQLMEQAYEEYQQGEESANLPMLYMKYNTAVQELEQNTDQSFEELYEELQTELKEKGFDPKQAEEVKKQYEEMKKETRAVMMDEVMEKFEV